jgi:hypothetical protein
MGRHPVLARAVVIGTHRDDAGEIVAVETAQCARYLGSGIAADTDKNRNPVGLSPVVPSGKMPRTPSPM